MAKNACVAIFFSGKAIRRTNQEIARQKLFDHNGSHEYSKLNPQLKYHMYQHAQRAAAGVGGGDDDDVGVETTNPR